MDGRLRLGALVFAFTSGVACGAGDTGPDQSSRAGSTETTETSISEPPTPAPASETTATTAGGGTTTATATTTGPPSTVYLAERAATTDPQLEQRISNLEKALGTRPLASFNTVFPTLWSVAGDHESRLDKLDGLAGLVARVDRLERDVNGILGLSTRLSQLEQDVNHIESCLRSSYSC